MRVICGLAALISIRARARGFDDLRPLRGFRADEFAEFRRRALRHFEIGRGYLVAVCALAAGFCAVSAFSFRSRYPSAFLPARRRHTRRSLRSRARPTRRQSERRAARRCACAGDRERFQLTRLHQRNRTRRRCKAQLNLPRDHVRGGLRRALVRNERHLHARHVFEELGRKMRSVARHRAVVELAGFRFRQRDQLFHVVRRHGEDARRSRTAPRQQE